MTTPPASEQARDILAAIPEHLQEMELVLYDFSTGVGVEVSRGTARVDGNGVSIEERT